MKRRILALLLACLFVCGFIACNNKNKEEKDGITESGEAGAASGENSVPTATESGEEMAPLGYTTFTLACVNNGDGTATLTATIPEGIGNGRLCFKTSEKLEYIAGTAISELQGMVVLNDDDPTGKGLDVLFATATVFPANAAAIKADFTLAEGAVITADDIIVTQWEIGDGTVMLGTDKDGDIIKIIK